MSYETQTLNGGVYTGLNNEAGQVNTVSDYHTLGNYYTKQCSIPSQPGQVSPQCVTISPVYGGVGYNVLQNGLSADKLSDSGYFSLSSAYPAYPSGSCCMRPLVN